MIKAFLDLIYPRNCHGCGHKLLVQEQHFCIACELQIPFTKFYKERENELYLMFRPHFPIEFGGSLMYFKKGSIVQHLLHQVKYKNNVRLAGYLSDGMAGDLEHYLNHIEVPLDFLLPVPIDRRKRRKRGYNQSELLSASIAKEQSLAIDNKTLKSRLKRSSQTKKGRFDRWLNVSKTFHLVDQDSLANKHILLIDDVITTGATVLSCIEQLAKVKGIRISVYSLAFADGI